MSELADKILAHRSDELLSTEVDGLGDNGEPLTIYFRPFTLRESQLIAKRAKGDPVETLVHTVIIKALDGKGEPIFDISHKGHLMQMSDELIADLVLAMRLTVREYDDQVKG